MYLTISKSPLGTPKANTLQTLGKKMCFISVNIGVLPVYCA